MKRLYIIFLSSVLLILSAEIMAQPTFSIKYHFRLYNESGQLLTCDSLAQNSLSIKTNNGILERQEYDTVHHYFFVSIRTTWPALTFVWSRNDVKMNFRIDCPTEYKDIYLDSLYFKPGNYYVNNDCLKNIFFETESIRHIKFTNYSRYMQKSLSGLKEGKAVEIKCRHD
jgi:hypothetical protein